AIRQTRRIFRTFKPHVVIGVGGYVTFLPVTLAWFARIPTWIHEGELRPGLANQVLSRFATRISTAFSKTVMPGKKKVVFTGQPMRDELDLVAQEPHPVIEPRRILVLGGSQGAHALDQAFLHLEGFLSTHKPSI